MASKKQHPLYSVWMGMRRRCMSPLFRQWADYGGRGIGICARWDSFDAFVEDMGERPSGYTLDRIDNDRGYSPENCRWADRKTQVRNSRRVSTIVIEGKEYRGVDLADKTGLRVETMAKRAAKGLSYAEVVSTKRRASPGVAAAVKARVAKLRARTHCNHGHEFTPENTWVSKKGWRYCRKCNAAKARQRALAKRA